MDKHRKFNYSAPFDLKIAEKIAVITLYKNSKGKIKPCRDTIDFIMNSIVRGYTLFDPTKGCSLYTYLINRARFAILNLIRKNKKKKNKMRQLSLDKPLATNNGKDFTRKDIITKNGLMMEDKFFFTEILEYINNTDFFNDRQRRILIGYFSENMSISDLAEELNIHRSYADMLLRGGVEKLKWRFNSSNK